MDGQAVVSEGHLRSHDVNVEDVDTVVNCHLHFDHCGGNRLFPETPILVQSPEYERVTEPGYTIPEWVNLEDVHYDVVNGEHEIWPGVLSPPTPGHTPGHQSLVLEASAGPVVLGGQIAESASGFHRGECSHDSGLAAQGRDMIRAVQREATVSGSIRA